MKMMFSIFLNGYMHSVSLKTVQSHGPISMVGLLIDVFQSVLYKCCI